MEQSITIQMEPLLGALELIEMEQELGTLKTRNFAQHLTKLAVGKAGRRTAIQSQSEMAGTA